MDTVLVTGGCGYIGSHTCISLLNNNYNVLILDSLVNSFNNVNKIKKIAAINGVDENERIQFIKGDLRDNLLLDDIFNNYIKAKKPIKSVIHFAGLKSIFCSIKSPLKYWDSNVISTLSLLESMQKYGCNTMIFSSSATVYKPNGTNFLKETDLLQPSTPYGKTKLCIEEILRDLSFSDEKWKIANLRYFNPVGSHSSAILGEVSKVNTTNLFPAIIQAIRGDKEKLLVFGKDWPTPDGTCIRDFIHVMDLADAHIATLKHLKNNKPQNIAINIGTGKGTSVIEAIETFQKIKKIYFSYEIVGRRLGDQSIVVADNKLALNLLNWKPKRDLNDMCKDSVIF